MSLRMILSSTDSKQYFSNTPNIFTVQLSKQLQFDGYWVVALTEFNLKNNHLGSRITNGEIFVCCDICQETIVGEREIPLLRRIILERDKDSNIIFSLPYYISVKVSQIQQIQIYLKDSTGKLTSFNDQEVTLTLHFKKFPYVS